jgi:hypothetical protein
MRVDFPVCRADFAETLAAMRVWLDKRRCPPVRFETAAEGELIRVSVEFYGTELVAGFREAFDPAFDTAA